MITNLQYLGIYQSAIDSAIDTCENVLEEYGKENEIDSMNKEAIVRLEEIGNWEDITNSIITAYFEATAVFLSDIGKEIEYYVNCDDSHFYIDGEEIY